MARNRRSHLGRAERSPGPVTFPGGLPCRAGLVSEHRVAGAVHEGGDRRSVLGPRGDLAGRHAADSRARCIWSWASRPELYSGKHKTAGMNIQVACNLAGRLAWISDPVDGSRHDSYCLDNQESSSRWIPVTGLAIKDMSAMA
jgi:DDE superfamily endonuclease